MLNEQWDVKNGTCIWQAALYKPEVSADRRFAPRSSGSKPSGCRDLGFVKLPISMHVMYFYTGLMKYVYIGKAHFKLRSPVRFFKDDLQDSDVNTFNQDTNLYEENTVDWKNSGLFRVSSCKKLALNLKYVVKSCQASLECDH